MKEDINSAARIKDSKDEIVYSEELPNLYNDGKLDTESFICLGCNAKSIPCSYKPDNLRRPYYKVLEHEKECEVKKYQELVQIGKKKKISSNDGFPVPYPSKLYLTNKNRKVVSSKENQENTNTKEIKSYQKHTENTTIDREHHRTSSTIRPIVKHFVNFPHDRHLRLEIPMINFDTYKSAFKKISTYKTNDKEFLEKYSIRRIYLGKLSLEKDSIKINGTNIVFKFFDKEKDITLKIDVSDWSDRKIKEVVNEIKDLQDKVKTQFSAGLKKIMKEKNKSYKDISHEERKKIKTDDIYIFFLGSVSKNDYTFELYENDHRLYYAQLITSNLYPNLYQQGNIMKI